MSQPPRRRAVALRYDPGRDSAPVVVARGTGYRAARIQELAEANGVVVREDPELVEALCRLDDHAQIPAELYGAAAELLAIVYRLHTAMKSG